MDSIRLNEIRPLRDGRQELPGRRNFIIIIIIIVIIINAITIINAIIVVVVFMARSCRWWLLCFKFCKRFS